MTPRARLIAIAAALLAWITLAPAASAHSQSYGYLNIALNSESLTGTLDIAVRDLDTLLSLDGNGDGSITWGEFRSREPAAIASVLERVSIGTENGACALKGRPALTRTRGGETFLVFPFDGDCEGLAGPLDIGYRLLFDLDAQHRGLVNVTSSQGSQNFVMTPVAQSVALTPGGESRTGLILTWTAHGVHHILIGYDHILFVITLLLGTVMQRRSGSAWQMLTETAKVITAFTLSHSITLGLAALGILQVPAVLAESLIAATIALAAVNNLWPILTKRVWLVALVFGLIHGVGFANVLTGLGLPRGNLLASLLAFNVGVEIGQLVIVAAALPVIVLIGRQSAWRYAGPAANLAIAAVALMWVSDRALGTSLMPF